MAASHNEIEMRRIYLDWGVVSNLKKKEYADLYRFFLAHKDRFFFVYSPAHFDDLMRSEGDPRLKEDLETLTSLVDDHLLAFNKAGVSAFRAKPSAYYEDRKKEVPVKLAEYGDILTSLDSCFPDGFKLGSKLKEIYQSIPFPIPQTILSNEMWGSLLPNLPETPSMLDVIQSAGLFVDKMQDEADYYKGYRSNIHEHGFRLEVNAGNWTEEEAIPNVSDFLKSKGVDKTFRELVLMPFSDRKEVSEYELFVAAYTMLDLLGYHSDKLSKPGSTINSVLSDAQHAYMASFCDYFITGDRRLRCKAKALYTELGIDTLVLSPTDAEEALQEDVRSYDSEYFFSFLEQEMGREDIVVERHEKVNDQDDNYDIYHLTQRLLGIFSRAILFDNPEKERIILLDTGTGRSTRFLYYDEVAMIVDLVSSYISAEPIPDYESIKETIVKGDSKISVTWIIRGGRIVLKNDDNTHKPVLVVILDNILGLGMKSEAPGQSVNHTVTPNNIHLESSFRVPKEDFERELKAIRERHPESQVWNRSMESLKREWAAHNAFHAIGIFRSRTGNMDLNWPQPWYVRAGYAIIGRIAWPFIK